MSSKKPSHISNQILNIDCPKCGESFATASHYCYTEEADYVFTSEIMCAATSCAFHKKEGSHESPYDAMRKVLKAYLWAGHESPGKEDEEDEESEDK